jgi:hypothetical protein
MIKIEPPVPFEWSIIECGSGGRSAAAMHAFGGRNIDMETKLGRRKFLKSGATVIPALAMVGLAFAAPRHRPSTACEGCADACFTTCKDTCDSTCKGNCQGDCTGSTK